MSARIGELLVVAGILVLAIPFGIAMAILPVWAALEGEWLVAILVLATDLVLAGGLLGGLGK